MDWLTSLRARTIVDGLPLFEEGAMPMRCVGADGVILRANPAESALLGYAREEYVGQPLASFCLDPGRAEELVHRVIAGETVRNFELVMRRREGDVRHILVDSGPLGRGAGLVSTLCFSRDISDRRQAEEELVRHRQKLEALVAERTAALEASHEQLRLAERLASIGTLAAGLGHDMSNILFPALCHLDALESGTLPEPARESLRAVREAVNYLRSLSNGLRLFALDPDDPQASSGVTSLGDWWAEVSHLFARALPAHVKLLCDLPPGLPDVAVPTHRLTQAVLNLVVNAGEAIPRKGQVRVFAEAFEDRRFVKLGVADDGTGMTPEVRRHALDPFFTTKKRGLSTGLGLSLVHAVTHSVGGTIDIDTTAGKGTTITLTLPAAETRAKPADIPVAGISLEDRRLTAYASVLLSSAGFEVRSTPPSEPGETALWVAAGSPEALAAARRYLKADEGRRVILVGGVPKRTRMKGLTVVEESDGSEGMRRSLRRVVLDLTGGTR